MIATVFTYFFQKRKNFFFFDVFLLFVNDFYYRLLKISFYSSALQNKSSKKYFWHGSCFK